MMSNVLLNGELRGYLLRLCPCVVDSRSLVMRTVGYLGVNMKISENTLPT